MHPGTEERDVEKEIDETDDTVETRNSQHVVKQVRVGESQEHDRDGERRILYPGLEADGPAFGAGLSADPSDAVSEEVAHEGENRGRSPDLPAGREHTRVDDADQGDRDGDRCKPHDASELESCKGYRQKMIIMISPVYTNNSPVSPLLTNEKNSRFRNCL